MDEVVGIVTKDELREIEELFEKKIALENLAKIIDSNKNEVNNKFLSDYGKTLNLFDQWWDKTSKKYDWKGDSWKVNFRTGEISLAYE